MDKKIGMAMVVLGFLLIVANAIDYLAALNTIHAGTSIIGIALVVVGIIFEKGTKY